MNICAFMGRLTRDSELKSTNNGTSVLRGQVAVDRSYTPKGEERKADFIDFVAWRQTAEFINRYFRKGDLIAIEGSIQTNNYTDKDGKNRKSVEVVVSNVSFCGGKKNGTEADTDFQEIVDDDARLPWEG